MPRTISLLGTSRDVCREAGPVLWRTRTFKFIGLHNLHDFSKTSFSDACHHMRSIRVIFQGKTRLGGIRYLRDFEQLQNLTICFNIQTTSQLTSKALLLERLLTTSSSARRLIDSLGFDELLQLQRFKLVEVEWSSTLQRTEGDNFRVGMGKYIRSHLEIDPPFNIDSVKNSPNST